MTTVLVSLLVVAVGGAALLAARSRRLTRDLAKRADERFMRAFFASPIAQTITHLDDQTFIEVNAAYLETMGVTREQIIGKKVSKVGLEIELLDELTNKLHADGQLQYVDVRVTTPDGRQISLLTSSHMLEIGGQRLVMSSMIDMTERRKLEDQVRQAQKLESIGRLAGGIAHDFNNLLNVIVGCTDLLREETVVASHREMLDEVDAAVARAAALTRQLLAFSRRQPTEAIVLDINRVVEDTRRMLRRLVGDDVTIRVSLEPEAGRVCCDPSQLVQILMNLAVNARDAMAGAGGTIHIKTRNDGPDVVLSIADDGCGMAPDVMARVFEPFFTTKEVGKGTGLGLAVVHGIVQQAGGTITVDSAVDAGTTFTVRLPRVAEQADAIKNVVALSSRGTERILLVDDDWHVRSTTARSLRSRGYTVHEADGGRAALRILDERPIDMLITDVVMPGMDGRSLFEAAHRRFPDLPVLFMSGYTDDEVVHRGVRSAELAFLEKPFRVHVLAAKVREVLDESLA